jgi:hypothetical protein
MRCQRCGFEISGPTLDCSQCDKRHYSKSAGLPPFLSYFLCVLVNAVSLIIALLIFKALSDTFEVIAMATLMIIYLTVKGAAGMNTLSLAELARRTYIRLKTHKADGAQKDEWDIEESQYIETQHTKAKVKMYINASFDALLYVVALFNLVTAL